MSAVRRSAGALLFLTLFIDLSVLAQSQPARPLSEAALITLVEQQLEDDVLVSLIKKSGAGFTADASILNRLKAAGASDRVLDVVRDAARPADAILRSRNEVSQGSDIGDLAIVLDCSGSMKALTPDGVSRMAVAKQVVTRFIRGMPEGKRLSFIVYGVTPLVSQAKSCQDVKVVHPMGPVDDRVKAQLEKYIERIRPYGATPIAESLRVAGLQLASRQGLCQLVLITDGMETCGGDPGRVAAELNRDLSLPHGVDVIGFGVSVQEKLALEGIVAQGKGHFYDARNAKELDEALVRAAEEAKDRARVAMRPTSVKSNQGEVVTFPTEALPWADRAVSFRQGVNVPTSANDTKDTLGKPDYDPESERNYLALGLGGELILEFINNILVDVPGPDLAIFEIGPAAESVNVAISEDGRNWIELGSTQGGKSTLDIASFVRPGQRFRFVRLVDPNTEDSPDGADIDAVGAIGSLSTVVEIAGGGKPVKPEVVKVNDPLVQVLIENLNDPFADIRARAAEELRKRGKNSIATAAVPALTRILAEDLGSEQSNHLAELDGIGPDKGAALAALKVLAPETVEPLLLKLARSNSAAMKRWAINELTKPEE